MSAAGPRSGVVEIVIPEGMDRMVQPSRHILVHGSSGDSDGSKGLTEYCTVIWGLVRSGAVYGAASLFCPESLDSLSCSISLLFFGLNQFSLSQVS